MTIVRRGNKWLVLSKRTGRILGRHSSRVKALSQLRAVEASKARKRPREHIRRVRTKFGRRRRLINRGVPGRRKSIRRKEVQTSLKKFGEKQESDKNIQKLRAYWERVGDGPFPPDLIEERPVKRKTPKAITQPSGSLLTRKEKKEYMSIIRQARKKGFRIPKVDLHKGPVIIDEVNIPENAETEAYLLPDTDAITGKDIYTIFIDDDASRTDKRKALAHELGHIHLYVKGVKPHTELKADEIAAKILGTTVKSIQETKHLRDNLARLSIVKKRKGERK